MSLFKKSISVLLFLLSIGWSTNIVAQTKGDYQLAEQYFKQGEFDKAAEYYLKVYKQTKSLAYFDKYINSLSNDQDYKTAEKALKKEIKKRPSRFALRVTLGDIYWQSKDKESAYKTWDEVIQMLHTNNNEIIPVAYLFTKIDQPQQAIKAYEVGKKYIPGFYSYYPQMADLYGVIGDYDSMIDLYLDLINFNPGYLQTVQNLLNRNFDFTEPNTNTQLLKQKLLQKSNQSPDNQMYAEMLIWLNLQQSNFSSAFIQVKSLDKRFKENGSRLINFARLANKNEKFDVAKIAYETVINKGSDLPYYETAEVEILSTKKHILDSDIHSSNSDYETLVSDYLNTIDRLGIADYTAPTVREMALIYAQKLQSPENSILWLEKVLDNPGVAKKEIALTKIDLGDYLLMEDHVWEAVLYYMQAEKAFKYDELGDRAKLKAAKVYYYTGDFNWAASKLNILKGSTSKLISNDALYLSNLITDNTTIDTNLYPMQIYAKADLLFVQQNYDEALLALDTLQKYYPDHMLADEALMQKYKILYAQKKYEAAGKELQAIIDGFSYDILGDDALFLLGKLNETHLNNKEKAMEMYLVLMTEYQDSVFVTEARKRYRKLRGDTV
jgi:tetratricopeptide (TPR) repeat protein